MTNDTVPSHLQRVLGKVKGGRPTRDGWDALCPCADHNQDGDQNPSLRIALGEDSRILINCRVGCKTDAVLEALGLDWGDLFAEGDDNNTGNDSKNSASSIIDGGALSAAAAATPQKADADLSHRAYQL